MYFYIKNGNLYYYDYKVFNGELSWLLVPLGVLILYVKKDWVIYFSNILICIAIIGTIDVYLKYLKPNRMNYLLGLLGILIIIFLPYWPYQLSKIMMIVMIFIIYVISKILYDKSIN